MLKKILIGILLIVLLLGGAAYYLFANLDEMVKQAIEKYGTQVTGTEVKVSSVSISTTSGEGIIKGLIIANPKGYSQPDAFELGSISIAIDTNSIFGNGPVIIRKIDIASPTITFEVDETRINLKEIQKNAQNYSAPSNAPANPDAPKETKAGKPARKIIISDLNIHDGQFKLSHALLKGKIITTPMPTIHLTDIGKDTDGASPAQIAKELTSKITSSATNEAAQAMAKQLGGNLGDILKNGGGGTLMNNVKGLFR